MSKVGWSWVVDSSIKEKLNASSINIFILLERNKPVTSKKHVCLPLPHFPTEMEPRWEVSERKLDVFYKRRMMLLVLHKR